MTRIRRRFEARGWEVLYRRSDVVVKSPRRKRYLVCYKRAGKWAYIPELERAYSVLIGDE